VKKWPTFWLCELADAVEAEEAESPRDLLDTTGSTTGFVSSTGGKQGEVNGGLEVVVIEEAHPSHPCPSSN
jgi:hypothetical protein